MNRGEEKGCAARTINTLLVMVAICGMVLLMLMAGVFVRDGCKDASPVAVVGEMALVGRFEPYDDDALEELLDAQEVAPRANIAERHVITHEPVPPDRFRELMPAPLPDDYGDLMSLRRYTGRNVTVTIFGDVAERRVRVLQIDTPPSTRVRVLDGIGHWQAEVAAEDDDGGFLLLARGGKPGRTGYSRLFRLRPPLWMPEVVADSAELGGDIRIAGQNASGNRAWLTIHREAPRGPQGTTYVTTELATCDVDSGDVSVVADIGVIDVGPLVPSPDGDLIALCPRELMSCLEESPLPVYVLDVGTGSTQVVVRGRGSAYPVAWSASVPRRLYFVHRDEELWQIDLSTDLGRATAGDPGS